MDANHIDILTNKLQTAIKSISLIPVQRIEVQTTISRVIREFTKEIEDPFAKLTTALGPTFDTITAHEKTLGTLVDELREVSSDFGKMTKNSKIYRPVTVRRNHRIVIKELPEGTVLRKEVYHSKRALICPDCGGTGKTSKDEKCKTCKGKTFFPVRGVMLEVL